jgi:hypothetical protein
MEIDDKEQSQERPENDMRPRVVLQLQSMLVQAALKSSASASASAPTASSDSKSKDSKELKDFKELKDSKQTDATSSSLTSEECTAALLPVYKVLYESTAQSYEPTAVSGDLLSGLPPRFYLSEEERTTLCMTVAKAAFPSHLFAPASSTASASASASARRSGGTTPYESMELLHLLFLRCILNKFAPPLSSMAGTKASASSSTASASTSALPPSTAAVTSSSSSSASSASASSASSASSSSASASAARSGRRAAVSTDEDEVEAEGESDAPSNELEADEDAEEEEEDEDEDSGGLAFGGGGMLDEDEMGISNLLDSGGRDSASGKAAPRKAKRRKAVGSEAMLLSEVLPDSDEKEAAGGNSSSSSSSSGSSGSAMSGSRSSISASAMSRSISLSAPPPFPSSQSTADSTAPAAPSSAHSWFEGFCGKLLTEFSLGQALRELMFALCAAEMFTGLQSQASNRPPSLLTANVEGLNTVAEPLIHGMHTFSADLWHFVWNLTSFGLSLCWV